MRVIVAICCWLALFALSGVVSAGPDDDAAAKAGIHAPAEWAFPPQQPLRVLTAHGLWYQQYGVERALAHLGGALITDSWQGHSGQSGCVGMRYFPESDEELMGQHLVVVGNINAGAFSPKLRARLKNYVERGGSLLLLGGFYAFESSFHNTAFEEISPVSYPEKFPPDTWSFGMMMNAPNGLPLAPTKDAPNYGAVNWEAKPRVYWYHPLIVKPDAKVLLTADGKPMLVTGTYGKGRVAVFLGSVMGAPNAGELPFWNWPGWSSVLATTMRWLCESSRTAPGGISPAGREQLVKTLTGKGMKKFAALQPALARVRSLCNDAATAKLTLDGINALDDDPSLEYIEQVAFTVYPFIDASFTPLATQLMASGMPHKTSLGLRLLGQCKAPTAAATLLAALQSGAVEGDDGAEGLGGKDVVDPAYRSYVIRLGAIEGLGNLGDAAAIPELTPFQRKAAARRSDVKKFPSALTQDDEMYLATTLALLRCGHVPSAPVAACLLLEHHAILIHAMSIVDTPWYLRKYPTVAHEIAVVEKTFPRLVAHDAMLLPQLATAPASTLKALAQRLASEEDTRAIPLAMAAFGRSFRRDGFAPPPEALAALATSKQPTLVELAESWKSR